MITKNYYDKITQPHNALTLSRLPLSFVALVTYNPQEHSLFIVFLTTVLLAGLSDLFDGKIARKNRVQSELGYILDGLCDRAFHIALILSLFRLDRCPITATWLLIFREVAIYALRLCSGNWFQTNYRYRRISLLHGSGLRAWVSIYIGYDILTEFFSLSIPWVSIYLFQTAFIYFIVIVSYSGLLKMFNNMFLGEQSKDSDKRRREA